MANITALMTAVPVSALYPTKTGRWGYKIGDRFGAKTYLTAREAKLALFDDFWVATQDDDQFCATD
jgi:hypothetical protein